MRELLAAEWCFDFNGVPPAGSFKAVGDCPKFAEAAGAKWD
jgi:hypothetical protein